MRVRSKVGLVLGRCLVVLGCMSLPLVLGAVSASVAIAAEEVHHEHSESEVVGDSHGSHEQGAPINFQTDLVLWALIVLGLFMALLGKFAWGPLVTNLDQREARVRADIQAAEDGRKKSELMIQEHERKLASVQDEVREILAEARRDAEHTKADIVATANKEAEATRQRVLGEIERAKDQALADVFSEVNQQVAAATEHVLGRSLTDEDQHRLVEEALAQLGTASRN